ncbi:hypothetical protein KJI95_00735 [Shewanella sp. JM162201]|uniref:Flagellar protein FliT n=1 Tax=Shewanella jiangmenensis TaxID=2837387 RepID=A0ABS5UY85_9GAMM|nr:hypothetical protein [Shewanella jiangmenensis]MBT1443054.1 hypothetical protein [Shewanella jiangmenensis]
MTSRLHDVNQQLQEILFQLENLAAEDEACDDLVLNLQDTMTERQNLLLNLTEAEGAGDRQFLQTQLQMTEEFLNRTKSLQAHRQQLLSISSQSKRQLNVYKTIDANR